MRALIVGAGAMGRWFAELTREWLSIAVADTDPTAARKVADELAVDVVESDATESFPVVCTAVPLPATEEVIESYGHRADRAIIDLSGTMREPLAAMREHTDGCERISLHPLFAPENAPGNVAMVAEQSGTVAAELRSLLETEGYTAFETTAAAHDRAMENVQAKVHTAVLAYALAADPVDEEFHTPVSAALEELVETIVSGNPRVYADIQARFAGADDLANAAARIAESDDSEFVELFEEARTGRGSIDDGS